MPIGESNLCWCHFQADAVARETGLSVAVFMMGTVEATQRKPKSCGVLLHDLQGASNRQQQAAVLSHASGGLAGSLVLNGESAVSKFFMTAVKKACQVRPLSGTS